MSPSRCWPGAATCKKRRVVCAGRPSSESGIIALGQAISNRDSAAKACAVLAIVGVVNIPIIKYSVEWWNTLHQPATFTITEKPAMPVEMWLPLLIMVLGFYCFFAAMLLVRMRLEVLKRESRTAWAKAEVKALVEKAR